MKKNTFYPEEREPSYSGDLHLHLYRWGSVTAFQIKLQEEAACHLDQPYHALGRCSMRFKQVLRTVKIEAIYGIGHDFDASSSHPYPETPLRMKANDKNKIAMQW